VWNPPPSSTILQNGVEYHVYDDQRLEVRNGCQRPASSRWLNATNFVIGYQDPSVLGHGPDTPLTDPNGNQFTLRLHEWMHLFADLLGLVPQPDDYYNTLADAIVAVCSSSAPPSWCQFGLVNIDIMGAFAFIAGQLGVCAPLTEVRIGPAPPHDLCPTENPPPTPCNSCGDVHIRTPDGLHYDFQGAGEYLLTSSSDGEIVVQGRQEPWRGSRVVSVNTAVAMRVAGDRVGIYLDRSPNLLINGQPTSIPASPLDLPNGGKVHRTVGSSRTEYLVQWPNGFVVSAKVASSYMDIGVTRPLALQTAFSGILGNLNGQATDDLCTRNGATFGSPILFDELYRSFGDSWRLSAAESLFDYEAGTSTETYQLFDFPLRKVTTADFDQTVVDAARQICEAAGIEDPILLQDCILDVAATGEHDFVESGIDSELPATTLEVLEIVNGGFDQNAEGWFWENVNSEGGWHGTGGNPDGNFVLNQAGETATDPILCQKIVGLEVGQSYRVTGDYASYKPQYGGPAKPDAFAVTLDGTVILELPRPTPVSTDWTAFTTDVVTGTESPTLCFIAERQGDDSSFRVDNVALKGTEPPPP
jgi:hypothetical protein